MNKLNQKLSFLGTEIKKKVFKGVAKSYNMEIASHFKKHPTGIGVTLQHFKPLIVDGNLSKETIAIFDKGYPAVLQQGTASRTGYDYPFNASTGTYVSFEEEPNLLDWARKNYKNYNSKMKGLRIGKEGTTGFGSPKNQWVFRSMESMKANSSTRGAILNELKKIKLK